MILSHTRQLRALPSGTNKITVLGECPNTSLCRLLQRSNLLARESDGVTGEKGEETERGRKRETSEKPGDGKDGRRDSNREIEGNTHTHTHTHTHTEERQ